MHFAVFCHLPDDIDRDASPLFFVESLADGRDAIGRLTLEKTFLNEKAREYSQEIEIVVPGLCSVVPIDKDVVEKIDAERPVKLIDVVDGLYLRDVKPHHFEI